MLVEGRHFLADVEPEALGHKALAVNLSDLAAMGALPGTRFSLALRCPTPTRRGWRRSRTACSRWPMPTACDLVGGDTTRGPRNLCLTVIGEVPAGQALRRAARAPATTSGCRARWATPRWRWRRSPGARRSIPKRSPPAGCGSTGRSRASRWGSRCAASRPRCSTSPTA